MTFTTCDLRVYTYRFLDYEKLKMKTKISSTHIKSIHCTQIPKERNRETVQSAKCQSKFMRKNVTYIYTGQSQKKENKWECFKNKNENNNE
jgi:hypothetical protein